MPLKLIEGAMGSGKTTKLREMAGRTVIIGAPTSTRNAMKRFFESVEDLAKHNDARIKVSPKGTYSVYIDELPKSDVGFIRSIVPQNVSVVAVVSSTAF